MIQMIAINANRYFSNQQTFILREGLSITPDPETPAPLDPDRSIYSDKAYQIHLKAVLLAASDCFKGAVTQKPELKQPVRGTVQKVKALSLNSSGWKFFRSIAEYRIDLITIQLIRFSYDKVPGVVNESDP